ncbi:hypothetical protein TTHERM_01230100 (macronuclear) [Tetrahymena thermophila SB210]|uniref:Uncharacterized protein n=1 Tax=Tetrahymena thermophila (strain SB210) TaxID=312017 RepID=Q22AF3_TETTS|nr:hypothetical protein TTHERM_01230100 [Tetrahymena thermophila SB210]EAR82263.1 hypothetical protein TTHERM_01230100 [Tetrahymena thermophila SB210]|eukprot:XP_001029926.1 hypothetical protein TTHERM_01230100 [Tetrahymena thermophila SB210]
MRMNLELKPKIIGTFKKIVQQLKKALMPQQQVYLMITNQFITLITEYDSKNLRNCNIKVQMGTEYFTLNTSVLESKQEQNQVMCKILDFNQFAQNVSGLSEQNCTVNIFLSKEGDNRYIKLKCTESESLVTQSRSEIKLNFSRLPFPEVDQKFFGMNIKSKDLSKLLDISAANQGDLEMSFNIRSQGEQGTGTIYFKLKNPSIKIVYDEVKVFDVDEQQSQQNNESQENENDKSCVQNILFRISHIHAKQLSHICSIDEQMSISILRDGSLGIEFWEAEGPENESTIIAMKHFIVPKLDDMEYEEANKMDLEQDYDDLTNNGDIKVEEEQGTRKKNRLYSDSEDEGEDE